MSHPSRLSSAYLKSKLSRPLPIKGGGVLRTVTEAKAYMIALPALRETRQHWQHAAALMMAEADVYSSITNSTSRRWTLRPSRPALLPAVFAS